MLLILKTFYFLLPAYFANMAPVIFARLGWLKILATPVDGGRKYRGRDLFGHSKTWRGFISAAILSVLVAGIQAFLGRFDWFARLEILDYRLYWPVFGLLSGIGAMLGDLIKSFFKRRVNIASGQPWPVFDQLDFIAGAIILSWLVARPSWEIIALSFLMTLFLHPLVNIFSYLFGVKKVWW